MKLTIAERNEIFRRIRSVLVRHWIDLGFLSIHVSEQTVYIKGSLKRLPGVSEQLSASVVDAIFSEIRHIRGVSRVQAQFDNWEGSVISGGWTPRDGEAISNWDRGRMTPPNLSSTFEAKEISEGDS
ncbi:MAG: hypothetical protein AB7T27_05380 [Kiritimatiellia bacterium]